MLLLLCTWNKRVSYIGITSIFFPSHRQGQLWNSRSTFLCLAYFWYPVRFCCLVLSSHLLLSYIFLFILLSRLASYFFFPSWLFHFLHYMISFISFCGTCFSGLETQKCMKEWELSSFGFTWGKAARGFCRKFCFSIPMSLPLGKRLQAEKKEINWVINPMTSQLNATNYELFQRIAQYAGEKPLKFWEGREGGTLFQLWVKLNPSHHGDAFQETELLISG